MVDSGSVSCVANTAETVLTLQAPTNQAVAWLRALISFEGFTAGDKPALIDWGPITASGGTSSGLTERVVAGPAVTPQATALNYTVEPTGQTVYGAVYCHTQSGYELVFQRGQDEIVYAGATWFLRVLNPTGNQTCNVRALLYWEE
jgi:hypothetical protein